MNVITRNVSPPTIYYFCLPLSIPIITGKSRTVKINTINVMTCYDSLQIFGIVSQLVPDIIRWLISHKSRTVRIDTINFTTWKFSLSISRIVSLFQWEILDIFHFKCYNLHLLIPRVVMLIGLLTPTIFTQRIVRYKINGHGLSYLTLISYKITLSFTTNKFPNLSIRFTSIFEINTVIIIARNDFCSIRHRDGNNTANVMTW